jgi:cytochrome c peroxidase
VVLAAVGVGCFGLAGGGGTSAVLADVHPAGARVPLGLPPIEAPPAAAAELGRALFFDRRLSVNKTLSCAMCHLPDQAFTANELRTSVGMAGTSLRRNAPSLLNVAYLPRLFVDGRAASLERQALEPLIHPDELANRDHEVVAARLGTVPEYRRLFGRAFGSAQPTPARIASALAAYQRTLLAGDSPFDRWRYGGDPAAFDERERRGFEAFERHGCSGCHLVGERSALFTDHGFHNTGVQARSTALLGADLRVQLAPGMATTIAAAELLRFGSADRDDLGRHEVTGRAADLRAFRTPSLRNVALTAPYMHDGSLATLGAVVDHYIGGGSVADPAQDPRIRPLAIDRDERDEIVAFLQALTSDRLPQ